MSDIEYEAIVVVGTLIFVAAYFGYTAWKDSE